MLDSVDKPVRYRSTPVVSRLFTILLILYLTGACAGPVVVGAVERVRIVDANLELVARIDTGAAASSLHAEEIEVEWDRVNFVLPGPDGVRRKMSAPIADHAWVLTTHGRDLRPRVALQIEMGGVRKRVLVSLRDRSRMQYKMLVGRDFLTGNFVVDVARGEGAE